MSNGCMVVGKYEPMTRTMSFELALHQMKKGGKVRRLAWKNIPAIKLLQYEGIFVEVHEGGPMKFGVFHEDLLAEDWVDVL